jgi:hypothetical protein
MQKPQRSRLRSTLCIAALFSIGAIATAHAEVDAITAATLNNSLKFVLPIPVTSTTATVSWTFSHTDGAAVFTYNGTAVTLTAAQRTAKSISLTGLTPSTLYTIDLLSSKSGETSAEAKGSFTTLGGTQNQPPVITNQDTVSAKVGTTTKWVAKATDPNADPITFTFTGLPTIPSAWCTVSKDTLILKPIASCKSDTVTVVAADGKGGLDTLNLRIIVSPTTSIIGNGVIQRGFFVAIGTSSIVVPFTGNDAITVGLFSSNGALMTRRVINSTSSNKVCFNWVKPGIYVVQVKSQATMLTRKIIVNR